MLKTGCVIAPLPRISDYESCSRRSRIGARDDGLVISFSERAARESFDEIDVRCPHRDRCVVR